MHGKEARCTLLDRWVDEYRTSHITSPPPHQKKNSPQNNNQKKEEGRRRKIHIDHSSEIIQSCSMDMFNGRIHSNLPPKCIYRKLSDQILELLCSSIRPLLNYCGFLQSPLSSLIFLLFNLALFLPLPPPFSSKDPDGKTKRQRSDQGLNGSSPDYCFRGLSTDVMLNEFCFTNLVDPHFAFAC